ncbi:MAG: nitronate monooxygenase [Hyphomicrobiales bacterium]|jgi:NAD(P)H-dependent flavin oxidoreductase YrpB (nitropropane dioxygenase family)|nr:nitronate monooxygenase [Alphaproteobacteria bacterium]MDG1153078.1 nitronate monooxygenase [Hyphomicrobiales bacterium]MBT4911347.1 nitronate monooxygenase [Alphaproteobacteria bacterium]MBT5663246.1 nitronate monooxygenase [Alphaproteobacteria bacterium]MDG1523873.1 nitronate monooxygenase [Hyphomicrobiales bacterium]|tara:strand:+ start:1503 stop:2636 length:1134 start_codon:yes stop_codon:yes gene_type:complete
MKSKICEMLGIEFPLLAFSHCRDVVAAVSKAGGMGVFGAVNLPPERLKEELTWIDDHVDGMPYGIDLIVPNKFEGKGEEVSTEQILNAIPQGHRDFTKGILNDYDIDTDGLEDLKEGAKQFRMNLSDEGAATSLEVAFEHPIKLVANALGVPPKVMLDMGKKHGVAVAALVGAKEHAIKQVEAGVDILIASGGEAGGHCGDVSTMVLIPEVYKATQPIRDVPILAAGGITTGSQMAAAMSMGASGAWCGSVWLTTSEAETNPVVKEKMLAASSRDTVRSKSRTGKNSRQLRSPWTDAWENKGPEPLPMPLQSLVSEPALKKIDKLSQSGHEGAKELATYWVGQGVGLMNQSMSSGAVVQNFKEEFIEAYERLTNYLS